MEGRKNINQNPQEKGFIAKHKIGTLFVALAFALLPTRLYPEFLKPDNPNAGYKPHNEEININAEECGHDPDRTIFIEGEKRNLGIYEATIDKEGKYTLKCPEKIKEGETIYILYHGWNNSVNRSFIPPYVETQKNKDENVRIFVIDANNILSQPWIDNENYPLWLNWIGKLVPRPPDFQTIYSKEEAQEVVDFLTTLGLSKSNKVDVAGHSWGALQAMRFVDEFLTKKGRAIDQLLIMNYPFGNHGIFNFGEYTKIKLNKEAVEETIAYYAKNSISDDESMPYQADKTYALEIDGSDFLEKYLYTRHWLAERALFEILANKEYTKDFFDTSCTTVKPITIKLDKDGHFKSEPTEDTFCPKDKLEE